MPTCRAKAFTVRGLSPLHHDLANAGSVQGAHSLGRVRTDGVADGQDTKHFAFAVAVGLVADDDHGLGLGFDFGELPFDVLGADRQFVGEAVVADEVMVAVDLRFGILSQAVSGASFIRD
jgi:hypothetical protein